MTARANLYVDQGVDFSTTLNLFTDSGDEFDISSQTFSCDVRKVFSSVVSFSAEIIIEPGGIDGTLELRIPSDETVNIEPGKYQYDVIMQSNSGLREKILEGLIFLIPTVTRSTE
jgi:hypothetical protein